VGIKEHIQTGEKQPKGSAATETSPAPLKNAIDNVPDSRRIGALVVIYFIVIVFWMIFHQNGSTLTYWANENTDWKVSGIISNAINPFWIISLIWFWRCPASKSPATILDRHSRPVI